MNTSESVGVDAINLVRFSFTYDVDTSDTLSTYSWSYCIITTSSSVKSTITNDNRTIASFTKDALFPIYDAVQSLFTNVLNRVGYSGTSAS